MPMAHMDGFTYGWVNPVLAYLVACLGAALGLRCTVRALALPRDRRGGWLLLAASTIGCGIWTMHFIAMMGFSVTGTSVVYNIPLTMCGEQTAAQSDIVVACGESILFCAAEEHKRGTNSKSKSKSKTDPSPEPQVIAQAIAAFRAGTAPHIVVRVNEGLYAAAREKIDDIARAHAFAGRLVMLGEPNIAAGDCRIEWADGGVHRDTGAADRVIGEAVARYISARRNFAGAS